MSIKTTYWFCKQNDDKEEEISLPVIIITFVDLFSVEVLATLTSDVGRILSKLHQVQPNGNLCLITGIRIAHVSVRTKKKRKKIKGSHNS